MKPESTTSPRSDADAAQLLLYLAGELSSAQAQAVERRLASDAAFRRLHDELRDTGDSACSVLAAADRVEPIDQRVRGVERQAARMLAQWKVDRLRPVPSAAGESTASAGFRRVPLWLYPLAAAAAVLLMLGVWSLVLVDPDEFQIADDNVRQLDNDDEEPGLAAGERDPMIDQLMQVASIGWNPLGDVGAESLGALERELDLLEMFGEIQRAPDAGVGGHGMQ